MFVVGFVGYLPQLLVVASSLGVFVLFFVVCLLLIKTALLLCDGEWGGGI